MTPLEDCMTTVRPRRMPKNIESEGVNDAGSDSQTHQLSRGGVATDKADGHGISR